MGKKTYEVDPNWEPLPDSRPKPAVALLYVLASAGIILLIAGIGSMFSG